MSPPSAFGPYRVLHQIGSGALGPVFRSYDTHGERLLAIKALKLDLVPEDAVRVADTLRAITSRASGVPGLVQVVECGTERGTAFIVLEYLSGDALDVYLRQAPPLTAGEARQLLTSIARTIDAAWTREVSHGALHPRDIFLGSSFGDVTITGFGVAQALESAGARTPVRHPYSAPERQTGDAWDRRADIFALGAIARSLVSRASGRDLAASWEDAMSRATADDPADRFETAQAFVDALGEAPAAAVVAVPTSVTTSAQMVVDADFDPVGNLSVATPVPVFDSPAVTHRTASSHGDLDLRLETASQIQSSSREPVLAVPSSTARFPWASVAAVGVAGIAIGVVAGYVLGVSRTSTPAPGSVQVSAPPAGPPEPAVRVPETPVPAVTPAPIESAPPAEVQPPPTRTARTAPARRGSLLVESRPRGATVVVDGQPKGETPKVIQDLSPGMHAVLIQLKGHRTVTSTAAIVAGEQTRVAVSLERLTAVPESLPRKSR